MYTCVSVHVCVRISVHRDIYIHTYMHACMYVYIYVCVCVFTVSASGFEGRGKDFGLKNRLKLFSLELGPVKLTARCDASP